ncbi:MAG: selenium metabolism-associated LysR family transcriptional regulator [Desulfovermiculus sp.]|nr:selenium metabolism-associated LysR family transcriptional regulator [Desulfovermiculus sp.]
MDIRRLETFCAVFDQKSFSRAGSLLYLAQPTISAHIASLEKELGTILFDRMARHILPTQAAETLYRHARIIIEARSKATAEIALLKGSVTGRLRLGGSTIPAHCILPQYLGTFQAKYLDVQLSLEVGDSRSIENQVLTGDIDLGIIGGREDIGNLAYYEVAEDELLIVAGGQNNHQPGLLDKDSMEQWPWIIREPGSGTRKAMLSFLHSMGIELDMMRIRTMVSSTQAVLACIQAGLGVSMVSSLAAAGPLNRGEVRLVQSDRPNPSRKFYAVVHAQRAQFPAIQAFLQEMGG